MNSNLDLMNEFFNGVLKKCLLASGGRIDGAVIERRSQTLSYSEDMEALFEETFFNERAYTSSSRDYNKAKVDVEKASSIIIRNKLLTECGPRSHDGNKIKCFLLVFTHIPNTNFCNNRIC